jgi:long-chain acyl-CoA synthetase
MNGLNAPTQQPASLPEIAVLRAKRHGDAPFLLTIGEAEPYDVVERSYTEVTQRALALSAALADAGVQRGQTVGCYMPNAPCWFVGAFASWWSGAAIAAVGTLLPGSEAALLFELAGVEVVIAVDDAPTLPDRYHVIRVDREGLLSALPERTAALDDVVLPDPDDLAAIFFTSGTTGRPKGIAYTHGEEITSVRRVAAGYARNADYRPDPAPAHLPPGFVCNAFGHTAGFGRVAFRMWIGRPSVMVPKFTVGAAIAFVRRFRPDSLQLTPAMIHMLATSEEEFDLDGVKYITSGTAPLSIATRDRFEARFGVPVMQAYGMTETGVVAQERLSDVLAGRRGPGSVGRLAEGVEIQIRPLLDHDRPEGEGEIYARTRQLPDHFVGGAEVPVDADGWFATGDIGRYDDGILYITGRAVDKIIAGGFNIYPAEVEEVARRSPLVADIVVVGLPDERLGERPVAGVVWAGDPDEPALLNHFRSELARYKTPRDVFAIESVPLTARDKVDRRRALELAQAALGR